MSEQREAGYYWCRDLLPNDAGQPSLWTVRWWEPNRSGGGGLWMSCGSDDHDRQDPDEVGPEVPSPPELLSMPKGERRDIITYRVVDVTGVLRLQGRPLEEAEALAERLATDPGVTPLTIERTTYVAFTHREPVRTVEYREKTDG